MKILFIIFLALAIFGAAGYFTYEIFVHPQQALAQEKLQPPPPPPPDPTLPEYEKCVAILKTGKLIEARAAFTDFIERFPESGRIEEAKNRLGDINTDIFLSTFAAPEKEVYLVKSGDVLNRVAAKMKTTGELLMRANNLEGTMLRIGQKLMISPAEFSLVITRKNDKVTLLNRGKFFKQYAIPQWPAAPDQASPVPRQAAPQKQSGKVTEKIAWLNGSRVTFADKGYANATHWILVNIAGCSLFSAEGDGSASAAKPPGGGLALSAEAMQELAALLSKGNSVTVQ